MEKKAYKQYLQEVDNWLHRGRRLLLSTLLRLCYSSSFLKKEPLKILEIGAGCGRNIDVLSQFGTVDAIEVETLAIENLEKNPKVHQLFKQKVPFTLQQKYDVISAMDFLEHVENDQQVFNWIVEHLNPNGIVFLTVPAYQFLFSYHDVALGHYKRYTLKQLLALNEGQLLLLKKGYFNTCLFPLAALSRVLGRLRKKSKGVQKKQTSSLPQLLDKLFFKILKTETSLISKYSLFPYGLTAFALLRKS